MGSATVQLAFARAMRGSKERTVALSSALVMAAMGMGVATASRKSVCALALGVVRDAQSKFARMTAWGMGNATQILGSVLARLATLVRIVAQRIAPCIVDMEHVIQGCRFVSVRRDGMVSNVTNL